MKKLVKVLSLGLLALSLVGCSCSKETTVESALSNSSNVFEGSKTSLNLTTQDIYKYVRDNEDEAVNKVFFTYIMENILDIKSSETKIETYNLKIREYFQEKLLDSEEYKVNGVFNEDLLANDLETDLYIVDKEISPTSGPTFDLGLKYDYSDYISRALNYDVYMEMLKEEYISTNKKSILDNSKTRIISIYTAEDLEDMEEIVKDLFDGKYSSLSALAETKRQEEIEEIGRQYCVNLGFENPYYEGTCSASTSSSTYDSALYKFTVCENGVRCTPDKGLEYQIKLLREKEYVTEQIINKNTTEVLYEDALNQLLRSDVEEYLHKVIDGQDYFLVNGLYNNDSQFSNKDIILSSGPDSECYLVTVRVVDSDSTSVEDKQQAFELLLDKVNEKAVMLHYLENLDIEITDPELKTYYNSLMGK